MPPSYVIINLVVINLGKVPVTVKLDACPDGQPCTMKRGTTQFIEVKFESPLDTDVVLADVRARILTVSLPWPGFNKKPCDGNLECPLRRGQSYSYRLKFDVKTMYPRISTHATFKLLTQSKENIFCFTLPLSIV